MYAKIQQFISNLVDEFQLNEAELNEMWNKIDAPVTSDDETTCSHTFKKGSNDGKKCDKVAKKNGFCTVHGKKTIAFTCSHTFNKGKNDGKKCSVKVTTENGRCSKHTIVDENNKKLSMKKWEAILFSQIPEILVKYYKQEKEYLDDTNLTRATANNAAAWILLKYETYFIHEDPADYFNGNIDFHSEMRDALDGARIHPLDKIVFDTDAPVPDEDDEDEWKEYNENKAEYDIAKKIYASQTWC